jgi:leucyl-tRNA synthetase
MHKKFDSQAIEKKWQEKWRTDDLYRTAEDPKKEKVYVLDMFPYPSGEGLHVGHPKGYIATDIYSRFKKMSGFEVLHPMGWDAFGLPAENFAIKHKVHPRQAVEKNIANFKAQLAHLGFNYDWSREINTTDPEYYKWTQWIFLKLLEKGLAYESHEPINWCPGCQTGLANEDLESDGTCERCGSVVEKKPMRQWVLKITAYADRMLEDLSTLNWPEHIKEAQRNWIGRSEGAEIDFNIQFKLDTKNNEWRGQDGKPAHVTVFTTRPDTLFGATYMVLAPEHPWVTGALAYQRTVFENPEEVEAYVKSAAQKTEIDRTNAEKEKTGVELMGIKAINPANGEEIPVFIADYVLAGYGTGAIMAVPAHDERDGEFAKKFELPIKPVVLQHFDLSQDGVEILERGDVVDLVIEHPTDGTFLLQREKDTGEDHIHFVGGGTDGEDHKTAIARELLEETGFTDFEIVKSEAVHVHTALAYRHTKNKNQRTTSYFYHLKLKNLNQVSSEIEQGKHTIEWAKKDELEEKITWIAHGAAWQTFLHGHSYTGKGKLINSGEFGGMDSEEAKKAIVEKVGGRMTSTYRLNDWVFSRQRYWGEPIPVIHCAKCGVVPVPYDQLPVKLPEVENYEPTGTGESPLAVITDWVNVECPKCGGPGKRETNTMPQWAGSSWYYLRFIDPKNNEALVDLDKEKKWAPVDVYVGGDHAVRHLIYARFWHKFLYDIGAVSTIEPFKRLEFLGFILAEDGRKMSKRWGNIINPDDIVKQNGADALRVYEMFMGPFENTVAWSTNGLVGAQRFVERVNGLKEHVIDTEVAEVTRSLHKTIKKVREDIEAFKFNTGVSAMMIFVNVAEKSGLSKDSYSSFLRLLAPFAPHLTEELWEESGNSTSIHLEDYPEADETLAKDELVKIGVQVNGKARGVIEISPEASEAEAFEAAKSEASVAKYLDSGEVKKVVYVPGRILNLII